MLKRFTFSNEESKYLYKDYLENLKKKFIEKSGDGIDFQGYFAHIRKHGELLSQEQYHDILFQELATIKQKIAKLNVIARIDKTLPKSSTLQSLLNQRDELIEFLTENEIEINDTFFELNNRMKIENEKTEELIAEMTSQTFKMSNTNTLWKSFLNKDTVHTTQSLIEQQEQQKEYIQKMVAVNKARLQKTKELVSMLPSSDEVNEENKMYRFPALFHSLIWSKMISYVDPSKESHVILLKNTSPFLEIEGEQEKPTKIKKRQLPVVKPTSVAKKQKTLKSVISLIIDEMGENMTMSALFENVRQHLDETDEWKQENKEKIKSIAKKILDERHAKESTMESSPMEKSPVSEQEVVVSPLSVVEPPAKKQKIDLVTIIQELVDENPTMEADLLSEKVQRRLDETEEWRKEHEVEIKTIALSYLDVISAKNIAKPNEPEPVKETITEDIQPDISKYYRKVEGIVRQMRKDPTYEITDDKIIDSFTFAIRNDPVAKQWLKENRSSVIYHANKYLRKLQLTSQKGGFSKKQNAIGNLYLKKSKKNVKVKFQQTDTLGTNIFMSSADEDVSDEDVEELDEEDISLYNSLNLQSIDINSLQQLHF